MVQLRRSGNSAVRYSEVGLFEAPPFFLEFWKIFFSSLQGWGKANSFGQCAGDLSFRSFSQYFIL